MRMSILAYVTLGIMVIMVALAFIANPTPGFLLATLPALLVLLGIPLILNKMNQRHTDKIDIQDFKLYQIKNLNRLEVGDPVRLQGTVESVSLRWLNRPHIVLKDNSGSIGVFMVWAPRESFKSGDKVEVVGTLRVVGLSKKRIKIVGVKLNKLENKNNR